MHTFSSLKRPQILDQLSDTQWDILIIGGGITGAGILLDAVSKGLKAALIEKVDFAWGTSSRSTKLIHGGLRYLKQFEIGLVREVGLERAIVYRNAMHIVRPERMLLPLIEGGSIGRISGAFGLWVYDMLADVEKSERRKMLTTEEVMQSEPLLRKDGLKGGGLYYEYRTDDARLTIEVLKKAVALGGIALNYLEATDFTYDDDAKVNGIIVHDHSSNTGFTITGDAVINAAGPWVDTLRKKDSDQLSGKQLHLTKGVHLVVPREKLPLRQSVYFDVHADDRMIFCIPREQVVYMGTTDTNYTADIDAPGVTLDDVTYILSAVNYMFPTAELNPGDVVSTWSGLRPLIHQQGKDPSELSRKDEIFISDAGLISIAGGKLTGYRKMAERVVHVTLNALNRPHTKSTTKQIKLYGGDFSSEEELTRAIVAIQLKAKQHQFDPTQAENLFWRYGSEADRILEDAIKDVSERQYTAKLLAAEVRYAIEHEMVWSAMDFISRRTGMLYFNRDTVPKNLDLILREMAGILNWSGDRIADERLSVLNEFDRLVTFS